MIEKSLSGMLNNQNWVFEGSPVNPPLIKQPQAQAQRVYCS